MRWRKSFNLSEAFKTSVIVLTPHQGVERINMLMQVRESDNTYGELLKTSILTLLTGEEKTWLQEKTNLPVLKIRPMSQYATAAPSS